MAQVESFGSVDAAEALESLHDIVRTPHAVNNAVQDISSFAKSLALGFDNTTQCKPFIALVNRIECYIKTVAQWSKFKRYVQQRTITRELTKYRRNLFELFIVVIVTNHLAPAAQPPAPNKLAPEHHDWHSAKNGGESHLACHTRQTRFPYVWTSLGLRGHCSAWHYESVEMGPHVYLTPSVQTSDMCFFKLQKERKKGKRERDFSIYKYYINENLELNSYLARACYGFCDNLINLDSQVLLWQISDFKSHVFSEVLPRMDLGLANDNQDKTYHRFAPAYETKHKIFKLAILIQRRTVRKLATGREFRLYYIARGTSTLLG
ncbi:hypothetical protein FB451DRAFT_1373219 [Mycena latifolia]|nr:hypothetical protein FB451DRAFT_1373219 [Mycena latifolia]